MKKTLLSLIAGLALLATPALAESDPTKGAAVFKAKCTICHALEQNKIGPKLTGVVGRKAASIPDFNYSTALKGSNLVWDEATLDKWLSGPSALVPGTKMAFKLETPQDRADVIAYLKTLAAK